MPVSHSTQVPLRERLVILLGATVWIALTGVLDYTTGVEIRIFPLYFLPICLVGWRMGHGYTLAAAWLSAVAWLLANNLGGMVYSSSTIWVVNTITQGASLSIVGFLMVTARSAFVLAEERSRTDSLTHLLNGRAFREDAVRLIALCERKARPVTVAFLDLDDFKRVNDRLGHARGDEVLATVAAGLREIARETDLVARLGGDEFALLLPETDETGAGIVLERIRARLERSLGDGTVTVSVSIGALTSWSGHLSVDEYLKRADAMLYEAKKHGKNRFVQTSLGA